MRHKMEKSSNAHRFGHRVFASALDRSFTAMFARKASFDISKVTSYELGEDIARDRRYYLNHPVFKWSDERFAM